MMNLKKWLLILVFALFYGCTYNVGYRPDLYKSEINAGQLVPGKIFIYTETASDEKVYNQHPSSFSGAATSLNVKLGEILKNISIEFFNQKFKDGAYHTNGKPDTNGYKLVIKPEILNFEYRYNQLKNIGFAITPETKIDLNVRFYDQNMNLIFENTYKSDYVSGGTYLASLSPDEKINKAIHKCIVELLEKVNIDLEQVLIKLESA